MGQSRDAEGFTLVELLVAMAVLAMMSVLMLSLTSSAQKIAQQTTSRTEHFREARRAFDRINQSLSQATLNVYWDYVDAAGNPRSTNSFTPNRYFRFSELRYLQTNAASLTAPRGGTLRGNAVFFQAPLGRTAATNLSGFNSLVNTLGFFLERGGDSTLRPPTVSENKVRYRIFELAEPADQLTVYSLTSGNPSYNRLEWVTQPLANVAYSHRLADNIVALLFQAQYKNAAGSPLTSFNYSSAPQKRGSQPIEENNLPPNIRVTMIAVDESSARRIADENIMLTDAIDDATLVQLENELTDNRLNYRKFESTVKIGPAKWSSK